MAFKTDESFLEKLTMGAVGTRRVAEYLAEHGHEIVELERYTTSNKIWSIKVKRLRLPDLLCLRCGLRVEARAKSKLEIKLSDSPNVSGREWGAGLQEEDLIALVACRTEGDEIVASDYVALFSVGALRDAVDRSRLGPPKSAGEGAERDRTWPSTSAKRPGRVLEVDERRIRVEWAEGGTYTFRRSDERPFAYVVAGDEFGEGDRLIQGAVRGLADPDCEGETWDPSGTLQSEDPIEVYASVKALGLVGSESAIESLRALVDSSADERIRLEGLGALTRLGIEEATTVLLERAMDAKTGLDMAMEAVLILSELRAEDGAGALAQVASEQSLPDELRAAAVWGLGVTGMNVPNEIVAFLGDESDLLAAHAVVAIGSSLEEVDAEAVADLLQQSEREAASAAKVLARQGPVGVRVLLRAVNDGEESARVWALYGLGLMDRGEIEAAAGSDVAEELASTLEPMWRGSQAWISEDDVVSLVNFVGRQTSHVTIVRKNSD
ncbi:MAG: HEAT repeat domain-containing protein [bacterium]